MADLKIYSSIGVRSAAEDLLRDFATRTGHTLDIAWATAPMLVKRIEAGEAGDLAILSRAGIDTLLKQGKIAPGSDVALASSGVAIAVKAGAPMPDISTPEALKRTLLATRAIAYSEPSAGGASGVHFAKLLERMGIADAMKPKTKYPPAGGFSAELLLTGEADLAVQQKPELLHVKGTEIVGPLPDPLNLITAFVAGIMPQTRHKDVAEALIAHLRTPEASEAFRVKGLEPAA